LNVKFVENSKRFVTFRISHQCDSSLPEFPTVSNAACRERQEYFEDRSGWCTLWSVEDIITTFRGWDPTSSSYYIIHKVQQFWSTLSLLLLTIIIIIKSWVVPTKMDEKVACPCGVLSSRNIVRAFCG